MRWLTGLAVTAVVAVAVAAAPASAAELVVDKDKVQCKNAAFVSIQAAVTAAAPGDQIKVCPDLYNEDVTVNKPLRLKGASNPGSCFTPAAPDPTRDSIVDGAVNDFVLNADGIVLERFVIQGATTGVRTQSAFSGYRIRHNVVQDNPSVGIALSASGVQESSVDHNCIRANQATQVFGVSVSGVQNSSIDHNAFRANQQGVTLSNTARDVTVSHNRSRDETFFGVLFGPNTLTFGHNEILRATVAAITMRDTSDLVVDHNRILDSGVGIRFSPGSTTSTAITVDHNDIAESTDSGIFARPNSLTNSLIAHNKSSDNGQDGIRIEALGNAGNTLEQNRLDGNAEHDCHDDSVGPGTAGTANFWLKNKGETENRPGLCVNS